MNDANPQAAGQATAGTAPGTTAFWQSRFLSYLLPLLVLLVSLAVSYYFWDRERDDIEQDLQAEFDTRVRETVGIFKERMLSYEQSLHSIHGLFDTSANVQRGDFQAFVANLRIEKNPGLQGMGYALYVPPDEKDRHVAAVRRQGFPAYALRPADRLEPVTSAVFFEPSGSTFLSTLGSDYFAEPSRRPAMEAARDTDSIAISNKVKLPEEDAREAQTGYRMYLPVYKTGKPHVTLQQRHDNIDGWIYAAFSMSGLLDNILGERTNIAIEVYDGGAEAGDEQLFDTYSDRVGGESAVKLFYASRRVDIGGYSWTLTARSLPNFTNPIALSKLQLVARVGVGLSLLLTWATWYLLRRRIRVLRAAAALRAAKEDAEEASRAKTRFLAVASHDLRQPLQALSLFVATLQAMSRRAELTGREVGQMAGRLQLALNGLGRLLNGLFDLSRLDSGAVAITRRALPVADLLHEVGNAFAGPAQLKGLKFRARAPHNLWVDTDPALLLRVLSNLTANAVRYTERGGILVGCRRRGGAVEIQVIDTGIGIEAGESAKVFGEFYQVSSMARDGEYGLGLGLAIVQRSMDLLGGTVQLRSIPGKGSVFSVTLPCAAPPAVPVAAGATPVPAGPSGAVLVIDDDPELRESMQGLLLEWGYAAQVAGTLEQAVAAARAQTPGQPIRLILSDYQLAGRVTGFDAIAAVAAALGRAVPAIIITGDTSAAPVAAARQLGLPILYKPVEPEALLTLIEELSAAHAAGRDTAG